MICTRSNRACHKYSFSSKEAALARAQKIFEETNELARVYPCPKCKKWHCTSKNKGTKDVFKPTKVEDVAEPTEQYNNCNSLKHSPFQILHNSVELQENFSKKST